MTVSVFTLGCKTNLYESGQIIEQLNKAGHRAFNGLRSADVFVLNTCAITKEAEKKSRQAIARARKLNPDCKVIITGCASQKDSGQFADIPNVTLIFGVSNKTQIVKELDGTGKRIADIPSVYEEQGFAAQERTRAFVKIQDGCNNFCSYCIVPYLRGRSRSRKIADIVEEVSKLQSAEAVLIGIDISQFGQDTGESLAQLFTALQPYNIRIRLGSLEARIVTNELLQSLTQVNFCPHFHLSLQSGCDETLKRMNRKYTTAEYMTAVNKIRSVFPYAGITTDVIVGFCGETDVEFNRTCDFIKQVDFADVHVFPFSPREGTAAYNWQDMDSHIKQTRAEELGKIKRQLKFRFAQMFTDKTCSVLAERKRNGFWEGYTREYLRVYFTGECKSNDIVDVKITEPYLDGARGIITSA